MRTGREVAVFVRRGDSVLVLRRVRQAIWHTAAGVVEDGEAYPDAAARELREETGLAADAPLLAVGTAIVYPIPDEDLWEYPDGVRDCEVESFAVVAPPGWEPVLNEEHDAYRWCAIDEAVSLLHWPEARSAARLAWERLG
ncbi:MAG TPA: NUDIX domain-containing protein [Candidatus Limnocylindria bacterium]|nr:NUDIX domain-containing protein [Candidatus Limnocylindria bacterium]